MVDHHDPRGRNDYLSQQHRARYEFAVGHLPGRQRVLDLACGTGYGTALMAGAGHDVVAADIGSELVRRARDAAGEAHVVQADAERLPLADASVDAVVSFETIEHLQDRRGFLTEVHRVLRSGGTLICSTPNVRYTSHPPWHVYEYEPAEFFEEVAEVFATCEHFGQYYRTSDRVRDLARWHVWRPIRRTIAPVLYQVRKRIWEPYGPRAQRNGPPAAEGTSHQAYRVRPLTGEEMLRIMVVVATKEAP